MIAILGPGGVGGFLAGALERAGVPVVLVAREATAEVLRRDGLRVASVALGATWTAHPRVETAVREPVDAVIVATKAIGLDAALDRVAVAPPLVLPLLNGLDHMDVLRGRFGAAVTAAAIRIQSDRPQAGVIEQDSAAARVDIADGGPPQVAGVAAALRDAGIDVRVGGGEADVLWAKLTRLNAIAATTTAFDATLGEIRADPEAAAALEACVRETAAVAVASGAATVDAETTLAELAGLRDDQSSSLRRDVAAGREHELDAICGAVLRAGSRHGVPCPVTERLAARIAARSAR